jgi:hypothetical protein
MDLNQLRELGGILSAEPIPKEISWKRKGADGAEVETVFTVHVVRQSFGAIESIFKARAKVAQVGGAGDTPEERSQAAEFICMAIRFGEDGQERISYQDAYQLDPTLAHAIINAANEVNQVNPASPEKN